MNNDERNDGVARATNAIIDQYQDLEGPLLPILHEVQHQFGYVPEQCLGLIAARLNLSRAEVHGVVSFYHEFRREPAGRHSLRICRAEACQSMGGRELGVHACDTLGVDWNETTPDGKVTLAPVYCLGLCSAAPAVMLDEKLFARLTRPELSALIREARK